MLEETALLIKETMRFKKPKTPSLKLPKAVLSKDLGIGHRASGIGHRASNYTHFVNIQVKTFGLGSYRKFINVSAKRGLRFNQPTAYFPPSKRTVSHYLIKRSLI